MFSRALSAARSFFGSDAHSPGLDDDFSSSSKAGLSAELSAVKQKVSRTKGGSGSPATRKNKVKQSQRAALLAIAAFFNAKKANLALLQLGGMRHQTLVGISKPSRLKEYIQQ